MRPVNTPSLRRRLACMAYEALLLVAVLFVASFPFVALIQRLDPGLGRPLLQAYVVLVAGIYFTLFWRRGQTLAMKTWRIRLEAADGGLPSTGLAVKRYMLACLLLPIGWLWALFSADRQFLHDRLAGTRLVNVAPSTR